MLWQLIPSAERCPLRFNLDRSNLTFRMRDARGCKSKLSHYPPFARRDAKDGAALLVGKARVLPRPGNWYHVPLLPRPAVTPRCYPRRRSSPRAKRARKANRSFLRTRIRNRTLATSRSRSSLGRQGRTRTFRKGSYCTRHDIRSQPTCLIAPATSYW